MSFKGFGKTSAQSRAEDSAQFAEGQAQTEQRKVATQTKTLQQQKDRDQKRAERLLFRSLRSAGGGFFASNPQGQTLGGTGVLG